MNKKKTFKEKVTDKKEDLKVWAYNHQDEIFKAAYIFAGIVVSVSPVLIKEIRKAKKDKPNDRMVWDPSNGWFWETKKLSNNKKLQIMERRINGEPIGEILKDMKVLR